MARIESRLKEACPGIEFVTSMANGPEAAGKIVERDADASVDGYLVMQMNNWPRVVQTIAATGKPTLFADFTYGGSGGFDVYTAELLRKSQAGFGFVASSDLDDLVAGVKCFEAVAAGAAEPFAVLTARARREGTRGPGDRSCRPDDLKVLDTGDCLAAMKQARILAVGGQRNQAWNAITGQLGIEVVDVPHAELNAAWEAADKERSSELADRWQRTARKIEGVSRQTLEDSAAMCLAQKDLLARHGANAITVDCLGGFYGNHIHAYPCLGFHELSNNGLIGACECDLHSTATMVALTAMTQGRPGFISDPVLDTSKRQIIYTHCVAPSRVFGPHGEANPIEILTHSEDRRGASVRSLCPTGYLTTTVKFAPERKSMIFHQGKAVDNPIEDRACRTKLAAEPLGDFEKLFREWDRWGWHRVTYYGDLKEPVFALADELGWQVVQEA